MWSEHKVRIIDIANELGVSTATVSNVIHGKTGKISSQTMKRVQERLEDKRSAASAWGGNRAPFYDSSWASGRSAHHRRTRTAISKSPFAKGRVNEGHSSDIPPAMTSDSGIKT